MSPPQLSAWTKVQLGWAAPEIPIVGAENRLSRSEGNSTSEAPHQVYKIGDGQFGFPRGEYLLMEFRKSDLLIGGIAIYHIDESQSDYNTEGYPNQMGDIRWPYNGKHYAVALAPADGRFELEQKINSGNSNDLFSIGQSLSPSKDVNGPFPNTDSYQNGVVRQTGVRICVTSDMNGPYMTFLFADNHPIQPWMTQLLEGFENGADTAISFESNAKVVRNRRCRGRNCATINKSQSSLLVTVETVCLTELSVSFEFYSIGLKNGEKVILEYSSSNGTDDDWVVLNEWTKGRATGNFRNRKWFQKSTSLLLTGDVGSDNTESSHIMLRIRHTSSRRKVFIDSLEVEGRF